MKILEQTPNRLVLRYSPVHRWLMAGIAFLFIFYASGQEMPLSGKVFFTIWCLAAMLVILLFNSDQITLIFDKQRGRVTHQSSGLRGMRTTVVPLSSISHLTVQERRARRRNRFQESRVYWLYLEVRSRERISLSSDAFTNLEKVQNAAWLVSDFLNLPPFTFIEAPPPPSLLSMR
jgi:hypothetical protein